MLAKAAPDDLNMALIDVVFEIWGGHMQHKYFVYDANKYCTLHRDVQQALINNNHIKGYIMFNIDMCSWCFVYCGRCCYCCCLGSIDILFQMNMLERVCVTWSDQQRTPWRRHEVGKLSTLVLLCERKPPGFDNPPHERQSIQFNLVQFNITFGPKKFPK